MAFIGQNIDTSTDDFGDLVRRKCLLVDKTLMIKAFLTGTRISLITRPRRMGKTLTLSMLQHFLSPTVAGVPTTGLFDQLLIAKEDDGEFLKSYQGQYPVIFITFKDLKEPTFEAVIHQLRNLVKQLYREHETITASDKISVADKMLFQHYIEGTVADLDLQQSLSFLSEVLAKAYGKKTFILIDEYDSPLTNAYQYTPREHIASKDSFLCRLSDFMRNLFSAALKTNPFLEKGLMTGILRVSKNNMLSGLNNLDVYTLLGAEYDRYFGFTEDEVKELLHCKNNDTALDSIRSYYNGYKIGSQIIYNPWSFMNFLKTGELAPYWVLTANDAILRDHLIESDDNTKELFRRLMLGESITGEINTNLQYEDLMEQPSALWTLLLFCGYLTIESKKLDNFSWMCELKIPNQEIRAQYYGIFQSWLKERMGHSSYASFLASLLQGDVSRFRQLLSDYLMASLSFRDVVGKKSEKFYHDFVLGLMASVRDTHFVRSNGESGMGLYDVMLIPKDACYSVGIVMEFKYASEESALKQKADAAMQQILEKQYDIAFKEYKSVKHILKVGIAFCNKAVLVAYQHDNEPIAWLDAYQQEED